MVLSLNVLIVGDRHLTDKNLLLLMVIMDGVLYVIANAALGSGATNIIIFVLIVVIREMKLAPLGLCSFLKSTFN
jgi:hypothetical protein